MLKRVLFVLLMMPIPVNMLSQVSGYRATYYVDGNKNEEQYRSHTSIESIEPCASVVYATNGVNLNLMRMRLNKTSGSYNETDRRETGLNSTLLADAGSKVLLEYCEVNSHTAQADGVSASGEGTEVTIQDGSLSMSRAGSAAANATNKATITVIKAKANTFSNQSPVFYTSNEGTMSIDGVMGETTGQASPLFYSAGDLTAENCRMSAARWTVGTVDGGNMYLRKNDLKSGSVCGFLVYGNKTTDASGTLKLEKNKITVPDGPLFLVTNTQAEITVTNNKFSYKGNVLMEVRADDWGVKGSNGGHATLNLEKQSLNGSILVDSISSLVLNLKKGGKLKGQLNAQENRCAQVKVVLEAGSAWTSKGDSHLTSIVFNVPVEKGVKQLKGKHTIYYDASDPANAPLGGKQYKTGGGMLMPE